MNAKRIVYSRHARRRSQLRNVSHDDVLAALNTPDQLLPSEKRRTNAVKALGGRFLRVTYLEEADAIIIVTVTVRKEPW